MTEEMRGSFPADPLDPRSDEEEGRTRARFKYLADLFRVEVRAEIHETLSKAIVDAQAQVFRQRDEMQRENMEFLSTVRGVVDEARKVLWDLHVSLDQQEAIRKAVQRQMDLVEGSLASIDGQISAQSGHIRANEELLRGNTEKIRGILDAAMGLVTSRSDTTSTD